MTASSCERVALVGGGSCTIGTAIARHLAQDGVDVLVGFRNHEMAAVSAVKQIVANGGKAEVVHLDINDGQEVETVCQKIYDTKGRLDILVNCAAINIESPALGMEDENWNRVMSTNASATFRLCRIAAKYMILGRWGRIINISSISAVQGGRGQINYAVSKAALESMTRVLALETGRKGVLANCVAPGVIESGMSERIRKDYGQDLLDSIAVHRFGSAEDVAQAVVFLASDAARYISGQVIRVDGGMYL